MQVYKDQYRTVNFEADTGFLHQKWFKATKDMTEEEYKKASVSVPQLAGEYGAKKILINAIDSLFPVSPKLQDWVNENTIPQYLRVGIEKVAILLPKEFFAQVSVEQIVDDSITVAQKKIQYFKNESQARKWLNS